MSARNSFAISKTFSLVAPGIRLRMGFPLPVTTTNSNWSLLCSPIVFNCLALLSEGISFGRTSTGTKLR